MRGTSKNDMTQAELCGRLTRRREPKKQTEFRHLVAFGPIADICGQFIRKGVPVYVVGSLKMRSWDDTATGKKMYRTGILVEEFSAVGRHPEQTQEAAYVTDENGLPVL